MMGSSDRGKQNAGDQRGEERRGDSRSRFVGRGLALCFALLFALSAAPAVAATTQLLKKIPYHPMSGASPKVKEACSLDTKIPELLAASISDIELVDKLRGGRVLELQIRDVHAPPAGMFSGPKWVRLDGTLKQGGRVIGTFRAKRTTVTGAGTCGMLNRCIAAIADDLAPWLANPTMDARLGNAK